MSIILDNVMQNFWHLTRKFQLACGWKITILFRNYKLNYVWKANLSNFMDLVTKHIKYFYFYKIIKELTSQNALKSINS